MQYSIVKLKEVFEDNEIFRFDADYYYPPAYYLYKRIKSGRFLRIKECFAVTKLAGFEYTEYFTDKNISSDDYYITLTSKNIQHEELVLDDYLKIDKKIADQFLSRSRLKKNDIVLSYTGEYRRSLVLEKDGFQLGPNICLVRQKEKSLNSYYVSTFFNCNAGQLLLDREKTLSAQPTVAMSRIREIPIPLFSEAWQSRIENIILESKSNQHRANELYKQAEQILLSELGLLNWKPKHQLSFTKHFSDTESSNRIDAEYFQPMYDDLVEVIKKYKGGNMTLGSIVKIKDKNFVPEADMAYKYIELANISANGNINGFIEAIGKKLPTRARRKVNTGDVIVSSIEGSLSCIALITDDLNNALCSTGFYVVNSDSLNSETLLVLLKSLVGQLQLKKGCSGTILTAIGDTEFKKVILPEVAPKTQEAIKQKITYMYKSKAQSKSLLEIAKSGVEMAIEKNEEEATRWLDEEVERKC